METNQYNFDCVSFSETFCSYVQVLRVKPHLPQSPSGSSPTTLPWPHLRPLFSCVYSCYPSALVIPCSRTPPDSKRENYYSYHRPTTQAWLCPGNRPWEMRPLSCATKEIYPLTVHDGIVQSVKEMSQIKGFLDSQIQNICNITYICKILLLCGVQKTTAKEWI